VHVIDDVDPSDEPDFAIDGRQLPMHAKQAVTVEREPLRFGSVDEHHDTGLHQVLDETAGERA
jgi:hypothetical protein